MLLTAIFAMPNQATSVRFKIATTEGRSTITWAEGPSSFDYWMNNN
jgi:hypothetical protein